jgi:hypothetical protein
MTPTEANTVETRLCQRRGDARRSRDKALNDLETLKAQVEGLTLDLAEAERNVPVQERLVVEAEQALAEFRESRTQEARLVAAREARVQAVQSAQQRAAAAAVAAVRAREDEIAAEEALAVALMGGADQ